MSKYGLHVACGSDELSWEVGLHGILEMRSLKFSQLMAMISIIWQNFFKLLKNFHLYVVLLSHFLP